MQYIIDKYKNKYLFFSFDFCQVEDIIIERESPNENLGQVLFGERIRPSKYSVSKHFFFIYTQQVPSINCIGTKHNYILLYIRKLRNVYDSLNNIYRKVPGLKKTVNINCNLNTYYRLQSNHSKN